MSDPTAEPIVTAPTEEGPSAPEPEAGGVPAGAAPEGTTSGVETIPMSEGPGPRAVERDPNAPPTYSVQIQVGAGGPVLIASIGLDRSAANNLRQAILDGGVHVVPE